MLKQIPADLLDVNPDCVRHFTPLQLSGSLDLLAFSRHLSDPFHISLFFFMKTGSQDQGLGGDREGAREPRKLMVVDSWCDLRADASPSCPFLPQVAAAKWARKQYPASA